MTRLLWALSAASAVTVAGVPAVSANAGPVQPAPRPEQQPQPSAPSPSAISAEIMILHGTNNNSGIDPKIGQIPALSKPPFSAYNSYKQLDRTTLSIAKGKAGTHKLPTGRELQVFFKDVDTAKKGDPRFLLSTSIQTAGGKAYLPNVEVSAKAGEWFFVAGQDYKGGSLVIGIKISP
ncbi:Hypothetical protein A7982_10556 [Minicystis rosea]|nr:Hypothetical protein A7982_10556 [Minicystis rosea]